MVMIIKTILPSLPKPKNEENFEKRELEELKICFSLNKFSQLNADEKKLIEWIPYEGGFGTIYYGGPIHRLLNYTNLPKPKNNKNFEKELEGLIKSTSALSMG
ncbi:hypothetical protein Glove_202g78 [Diversispora epigaea]|uniref:Uncharacterized protein n=1 Tax=Diversispora epigaea TaxID=1348612 RepID=A0A397IMC7_9GLOM|nr:hypothetical protein Glove_202g78 [Diversispora epigaea]